MKSWLVAVMCNIALAVAFLLESVSLRILPLSDHMTYQFTALVFAVISSVLMTGWVLHFIFIVQVKISTGVLIEIKIPGLVSLLLDPCSLW